MEGVIKVFGDAPLTIEALVQVARGGARLRLAPAARARLAHARTAVERLAAGDVAVYGLTTALGAGADTRLAAADITAFQERAVRARSVAVGPRLPRAAVRAAMAARAAGLAAGGSGASPAVAEALIAALNAGVHPVVPRRGSLGAGDLAPLAHIALVLIGRGAAELDGAILPGAEALARTGLAPLALGPKDGHALIVSNAVSAGTGALAWHDAARAIDALAIAAALSLEGFRGNLSPLDPRVQAARQAPGQVQAATRLTALLAGSALWQRGAARRLQDPLSFRCIAPVHGAAHAALDFARAALEVELGAAGDNPLLADDGTMIANGNFDTTALALGFEMLGQALAQTALLATQRVVKLMSPAMSGLPRFLTPRDQSRSGYSTVQKTAGTLEAEIRHLALPVSLAVQTTAEGVEDHATMAPRVIEKLGEIVERLQALAAIELVVAAQAVDLRGSVALGPPLAAVHAAVREAAPALDDDRETGPDIERVIDRVDSGAIQDAAATG